jgi:hypothetical protein
MVAYYEKQPQYPPMHGLTTLAAALEMVLQEIMGQKELRSGESGAACACGAGWSKSKGWRRSSGR